MRPSVDIVSLEYLWGFKTKTIKAINLIIQQRQRTNDVVNEEK